jgi:hypothetical protein
MPAIPTQPYGYDKPFYKNGKLVSTGPSELPHTSSQAVDAGILEVALDASGYGIETDSLITRVALFVRDRLLQHGLSVAIPGQDADLWSAHNHRFIEPMSPAVKGDPGFMLVWLLMFNLNVQPYPYPFSKIKDTAIAATLRVGALPSFGGPAKQGSLLGAKHVSPLDVAVAITIVCAALGRPVQAKAGGFPLVSGLSMPVSLGAFGIGAHQPLGAPDVQPPRLAAYVAWNDDAVTLLTWDASTQWNTVTGDLVTIPASGSATEFSLDIYLGQPWLRLAPGELGLSQAIVAPGAPPAIAEHPLSPLGISLIE